MNLTDDEFAGIIKHYFRMVPPDIAHASSDKWLPGGRPSSEGKESILRAISAAFQKQRHTMLNDRGVTCLSEKVDDLLMWGHYAEGHRGFCLEFDSRFDPFHKAIKVTYSDSIPIVDPVPLIYGKSPDGLLSMITTKAACWAYEQEWRVIHMEGDKAYAYSPAALTGVYFGVLTDESIKCEVGSVLSGSGTRLYEMQRNESEFRLEPRTPPS